jgi:hypothetical protein
MNSSDESKNEVIICPSDFAAESFFRRLGFPIQKLANHFFSSGVPLRLNNLVCLHTGRSEIDLRHDLRDGLPIVAAEHFVFSSHVIRSRSSGVLVLDFLQALQYQVQIGRFDFGGGRRSL